MSGANKSVARRVIEGFLNSGDPAVADELFAPDYVDHSASHPELSGPENVKRSIGEWRRAFPDSQSKVEAMISEGDMVAARWTTRATHRGEFMGVQATGRQVEITGMGMFRIAGGRVVESWDVSFDSSGLLRQLGASPDRVGAQEILDFWFGPEDDPGYGEFRRIWFEKNAGFDAEVRARFSETYERAVRGELDDWMQDARGAVALVILLDQFPRNMFRGDPRTHATDARACDVARHAREQALDRELPPHLRQFLYMPFMHSEELEDQRLSVELFGLLAEEPGGTDVTEYARGHMEIIERFGRFPHRNAILGRTTTPEEAEFLQGPGSSF